MANRPVFVSKNSAPFYTTVNVEFQFVQGFAITQKQKCIKNLHESFLRNNHEAKVLEVSSKSADPLGMKLSAFNLKYDINGKEVPLECVFQSSKVFEKGGPYTDLLEKTPIEAKKDDRIRNSGKIIGFNILGTAFPTEPRDLFYNWIYTSSLCKEKNSLSEILKFNAFTDIEFNPQKSLNCQARTVAIIKGLSDAKKLDEALKSINNFENIVYEQSSNTSFNQMKLFDTND